MERGTAFSIVADIEAKSTLAAITDGEKTEVLINGTGGDVTALLVTLISSCMVNYAKSSGATTKEEFCDRTAFYAASLVRLAGREALGNEQLKEAIYEEDDE